MPDIGSPPLARSKNPFAQLSAAISIPVINIKNYAKGDGITDDTAAINSAFAVAATTPGLKQIIFPCATYVIAGKLDLSVFTSVNFNRVDIDLGGSTLSYTGSTTMFSLYNNWGIAIRNGILSGAGSGTGIFVDSLQTNGSENILLDGLTVQGFSIGLLLGSTTGGTQNRVAHSIFSNLLIQNCADGIKLASTTVDRNIFSAINLSNNSTAALHLNRSGSNTYIGVTGFGSGQTFILKDGPALMSTFIACQSESPGPGVTTSLSVTDYGPLDDGLGTGNAEPMTFIGCQLSNVTFAAGSGSRGKWTFIDCQLLGANFFNHANDLYIRMSGCDVSANMTLDGTNTRLWHDNTHITGTITATNGSTVVDITANGTWTNPSFSASNFTGINSMTWTVSAGNVVTLQYTQVGNTMTVAFYITGTSVAGVLDYALQILIPNGKTAAATVAGTYIYSDNGGTETVGSLQVSSGDTHINLLTAGVLNWHTATGTTTARGQLTFPVQ